MHLNSYILSGMNVLFLPDAYFTPVVLVITGLLWLAGEVFYEPGLASTTILHPQLNLASVRHHLNPLSTQRKYDYDYISWPGHPLLQATGQWQ